MNKYSWLKRRFMEESSGGEGGGGEGGGEGGNAGKSTLLTPGAKKEGGEGGGQGGGSGGETVPEWMKSLPDELKGSKSLARYKDPVEVAKAYVNLEKLNGNRITIPGDDATPEARAEFYSKLGRPDKPESYKIPEGLKLPDGLPIDKGLQENLQKVAFENGISQKQFEALYKGYMEDTGKKYGDIVAQQKAAAEKGINDLKAEWQNNFDTKLNLAVRAVAQFGGPELQKWLAETGLGNHPNFIRLFANIAEAMGEDLAGGEGDGGLNPESAKEQLEAFKKDAELMKALDTKSHPNHKQAVATWEKLHKALHPGVEGQV